MTTKPKARKAPDDPIFALIEASDAAHAAFAACRPIEDNMSRAAELLHAMKEANELLYTAVPQTRAGTLAYIEWHAPLCPPAQSAKLFADCVMFFVI